MSVTVHVAVESGRLGMPKTLAERAARAALRSGRVANAELSVTFVSDRMIAGLNRKHLGRRGTTDVIAFGFPPVAKGAPLVGDVYIATDVARRSARERGIAVREELLRLVVHGTLHVMGHDHPEDETRTGSPMWNVQERLVARLLRGSAA